MAYLGINVKAWVDVVRLPQLRNTVTIEKLKLRAIFNAVLSARMAMCLFGYWLTCVSLKYSEIPDRFFDTAGYTEVKRHRYFST